MAQHKKFYDVFAVGGIVKTIDRTKAVRICGVEASTLKEAEKHGQRFCNLTNSTMTHIVQTGYATKGKRNATNDKYYLRPQ